MTTRRAVLTTDAERTARRLLTPLGNRWLHTVGVAERAAELAKQLRIHSDVLVSAAWLHDIGYAPALIRTGFHPLDGARFLAERGWPARVVGLVAQHSGARFLAASRGLAHALAAYPDGGGLMSDALTYADQTVGPAGDRLTWRQRHAEALSRHGPGSWHARVDPVRRSYVESVADRVERRLACSTALLVLPGAPLLPGAPRRAERSTLGQAVDAAGGPATGQA